jgi:membrane peptidoglycan carboxypeptidase
MTPAMPLCWQEFPSPPTLTRPSTENETRVLHRRNEILGLMAKDGFLSRDAARAAEQRPIQWSREHIHGGRQDHALQAPAGVNSALDELHARHSQVNVEDLFQGRIQLYATADARVQRIVNQALEQGLESYEKRHPEAQGITQGALVVLRNSDASVLAETRGRPFYNQRTATTLKHSEA